MIENKSNWLWLMKTGACALACVALVQVSCTRKPKKAEECPEPDTAVVQVHKLGTVGVDVFKDKNEPPPDRCVACVMSQQRFASCQTVYATSKDESRDSVRARAKEKACLDAGYKKGQCPQSAVISVRCKDEPRPEGAMDPGQAIQKLFGKDKKVRMITATPPGKDAPQTPDRADPKKSEGENPPAQEEDSQPKKETGKTQ